MKNIFKNLKEKMAQDRAKNKEMKLQNEKYKYVTVLRLLSILIIGALATVILITCFFVYRAVTGTIGQVQSISLYQTELKLELIDFNRFEKVEKTWKVKFTDNSKELTRNPFVSYSGPGVATSTSQKSQ